MLLLPAEGVRGAVQARQEATEASDLQTPEVRDTSSLRRRRIRRRGSSWRRHEVQHPEHLQPVVCGVVDRPLLPADDQHSVVQRIRQRECLISGSVQNVSELLRMAEKLRERTVLFI